MNPETVTQQAPEQPTGEVIDAKEKFAERSNKAASKRPYNTPQAEEARTDALSRSIGDRWNDVATALIEAGLVRYRADVPDVADHNTLTLSAALQYGECGLHAVDSHALHNNGKPTNTTAAGIKVPRGAKWQDRATTDPDELIAFWTGNGKYPKNSQGKNYSYANVKAPRNVSIVFPEGCGLFALDLDGEAGLRALEDLEEQYGQLPDTPTSISGSGGAHLIFRTSEPILNTASAIAPGVDIRGEGGQIIAAPSVHPSGGFYRWEEDLAPGEVDIADAPEWLVNLALEASKKTQTKPKYGRRRRAEGQAPSEVHEPIEPTGDSTGFEAKLATIGDNADGFDMPIYRAACSWFAAHGVDADTFDLKETLQCAVIDAECDDSRNVGRYATDEYLDGRIKQARTFITKQRAEEAAEQEDDEDEAAFQKVRDHGTDVDRFDGVLCAAAQEWFRQHGLDADASILKTELVSAITDSKYDGDEFLTDEYLDELIEESRGELVSLALEASRSKGPSRTPRREMVEDTEEEESASADGDQSAESDSDPFMTLDITAPLPPKAKDAVAALEYRFKYVSTGGKAAFLQVADYRTEGMQMAYWPKLPLKEYHENRRVKHKGAWVNPVDLLIKSAKRYSKAEFAPYPVKQLLGSYNLFKGWSLDPVQGDCERLKNFLKDVICAGDEDSFKWLWLWLAHRVQRPGEKPGTSIVMHGKGGIGKGTFGEMLRRLFGPYFITVDSTNQVLGTHAGTRFLTAVVCVIEEAFFVGDRKSSNTLKSRITNPYVDIDPKFLSAYQAPNYTGYVIDGNDFDLVRVENNGSERRFFVVQVSSAHFEDKPYWNNIYSDLGGTAMAAMMHELQTYDPAADDFTWSDVRTAPDTMARRRMAYYSLEKVERVLLGAFDEGTFKIQVEGGEVIRYEFNWDKGTRVNTTHLNAFLAKHVNKHDGGQDDPAKIMEQMLKGACDLVKGKGKVEFFTGDQTESVSKTLAYVEFPPLSEIHAVMVDMGFRDDVGWVEDEPEQ